MMPPLSAASTRTRPLASSSISFGTSATAIFSPERLNGTRLVGNQTGVRLRGRQGLRHRDTTTLPILSRCPAGPRQLKLCRLILAWLVGIHRPASSLSEEGRLRPPVEGGANLCPEDGITRGPIWTTVSRRCCVCAGCRFRQCVRCFALASAWSAA